tara:strand:- start:124 stop:1893 length:1770 start_codon:yes stop_codon:yes gene_type:complete
MLSLALAGVHAAAPEAVTGSFSLQPAGGNSLLSCQSWCPAALQDAADQEHCRKLACAACESCVNAAKPTRPLFAWMAPSSKEPTHATSLPASTADVNLLTSADQLELDAFSAPLFETSKQETALELAKKIVSDETTDFVAPASEPVPSTPDPLVNQSLMPELTPEEKLLLEKRAEHALSEVEARRMQEAAEDKRNAESEQEGQREFDAERTALGAGTYQTDLLKPALLTHKRTALGEFEYDETPCKQWCGLPKRESSRMHCGVFWFLHVPKTAGTTLSAFLKDRAKIHGWSYANMWKLSLNESERAPPLSEVHWKRWNTSDQWTRNVLRELKRPRPHVIIHDHHQFPGLGNKFIQDEVIKPMAAELAEKGCELRFATSLREPIGHTMSRVRNEFATEGIHDRFMNFSKSNANSMAKYVVYNFQTQWPVNMRSYNLQPDVDEELLRESSEILSMFDLVGRSEEFEEFFKHVRMTLGWEGGKIPDLANSHHDYLQRAIDERMEDILNGTEVSPETVSALEDALRRNVSRQTFNNTLWAHEAQAVRVHNAVDSRLYHQFCTSSPYSVCEDRTALRALPRRLSKFVRRYLPSA